MQQLTVPAEPGQYAFKVATDSVEYLGPARLAAGSAWAVPDALSYTPQLPSDDVYAVSGWLVGTSPAPCAGPAVPPEANTDYWCGGSWLTQDAESTVTATGSPILRQLDGLPCSGRRIPTSQRIRSPTGRAERNPGRPPTLSARPAARRS